MGMSELDVCYGRKNSLLELYSTEVGGQLPSQSLSGEKVFLGQRDAAPWTGLPTPQKQPPGIDDPIGRKILALGT